MNIDRRQFVTTMATGAASVAALPHALAAGRDNENQFSFLLLGDTHFDRIEHHDLEWMKAGHFAKDISQVESYCQHTTDVLPKLLRQQDRD